MCVFNDFQRTCVRVGVSVRERQDTCLRSVCGNARMASACEERLMRDTVESCFFSLLFLVTIVRANLETIRFIKIPGTFSFSYWTPSRCAKILIDKCATVPPASLSISVTVSFRPHLPQFLSGTCGNFVEDRSLSFLSFFCFFFFLTVPLFLFLFLFRCAFIPLND